MVFCPNCGLENNDSAKFCKNCGNSLRGSSPIKEDYVATGNDPTARNSNINTSNNNSKFDNKNLIIICLTIVICAILIAGALVLFSNNGSDNNSDALSDSASLNGSDSVNNSVEDTSTSASAPTEPAKTAESNMDIISGSISTGSGKNDKTYCSVYVGEKYAGQNVKISVLYSRDGNALNNGNIVPKTVDSSGYASVPSASAFKYYPDDAFITIYDSSGNVLDTQEVYLSERSGTQTF